MIKKYKNLKKILFWIILGLLVILFAMELYGVKEDKQRTSCINETQKLVETFKIYKDIATTNYLTKNELYTRAVIDKLDCHIINPSNTKCVNDGQGDITNAEGQRQQGINYTSQAFSNLYRSEIILDECNNLENAFLSSFFRYSKIILSFIITLLTFFLNLDLFKHKVKSNKKRTMKK